MMLRSAGVAAALEINRCPIVEAAPGAPLGPEEGRHTHCLDWFFNDENMIGLDLSYGKFYGRGGATFLRADMQRAILNRADVRQGNFFKASLAGARMEGTN